MTIDFNIPSSVLVRFIISSNDDNRWELIRSTDEAFSNV